MDDDYASSAAGKNAIRVGFRYTGVVAGNNDPTQQDRVQVKIAGLNDSVDGGMLPWWSPADSHRTVGGKAGSGASQIPDVGSKVWVIFDKPDPYRASYYPYPITADTKVPEASIAYPNTPVFWRLPNGAVMFYNRPSGEFLLRNPGGAMKLRTQGDFNLLSDSGNVNVECNTARVHARSQAHVHAQSVDIKTNRFSINHYSAAPKPDVGPYPKG